MARKAKEKIHYDYTDLETLIIQKCETKSNFADHLGWDLPYLSNKLADRVNMTKDDVTRIAYALSIPKNQIGKYFFTVKGARHIRKVERILNNNIEDYDFETEIE